MRGDETCSFGVSRGVHGGPLDGMETFKAGPTLSNGYHITTVRG